MDIKDIKEQFLRNTGMKMTDAQAKDLQRMISPELLAADVDVSGKLAQNAMKQHYTQPKKRKGNQKVKP